MRGMFTIMKKELAIFMASPIFYAALFIFLVLTGYFFYSTVVGYSLFSLQASSNPYLLERLNLTDLFLKPFFADIAIILLLMLPLISMRTYAEEKKSGTIELLFTYPISDLAVLAGKFGATVLILIIMLAATVPPLLLLAGMAKLEWGLVLTGYVGLILLGGSFLALGIFASSITENQIVAAVVSFGTLLLFWVLAWGARMASPAVQEIIRQLSVVGHMETFLEGVVDTRDLIFYFVFCFFWLFLTLRLIHSRFWRG